MSYTQKTIYHNYSVLSPNGIEMFRCDKKKFDWYLKKGLAIQIDQEVIRLLFEPKGLGWAGEQFYLQNRENKCCCCGADNMLSKHHVIPYCYRKHMPNEIKDNNYFDVLPLCTQCHSKYEKIAMEKRLELSNRFNVPLEGINNDLSSPCAKIARTLYRYKDSIPEKRRKEMREIVAKHMGKESISDEELENLGKIYYKKSEQNEKYISNGKAIVEKIDSFQDFFEEWRSHFVSTMNPKYIPPYWEITRDSHGRKK